MAIHLISCNVKNLLAVVVLIDRLMCGITSIAPWCLRCKILAWSSCSSRVVNRLKLNCLFLLFDAQPSLIIIQVVIIVMANNNQWLVTDNNPLRTVVAYMHQGNKYFTLCKQIIISSLPFTLLAWNQFHFVYYM